MRMLQRREFGGNIVVNGDLFEAKVTNGKVW